MNQTHQTTAIRVWDLPLRVFHWSLLITITGLFVSAKLAETAIGAQALQWHFCFGYCALTLLLFRIVWGFMGSRYAKFVSFPPNPMAAWRTFKGVSHQGLGHNPMGALSVYALLTALTFQAISGLFCNDDTDTFAPLALAISKDTSDLITLYHKANETVIIVLVVLHLSAIAFHHFKRREPLVKAMITGDKPNLAIKTGLITEVAADDSKALRLKALAIFVMCAAIVAAIIIGFK
jgi:cytochrome b